jgi:hypothetical protein
MRIPKNVLLAVLFLLAGCVSLPQPQAPTVSNPKADASFPQRIAVLPVNNMAGDADGAIILRAFIIRKLENDLGASPQKPEDTDQIIHDRTLTGSEVPVQVAIARFDLGMLTTWLGVDGILHAQLLAFNRAKLAVYLRSEVKAHFWLTDKTGKTIWDVTKDSNSGTLTMGGGRASLDSVLAGTNIPPDVMDRVRQSPLGESTLDLVDDAFSTFPKR